MRISISKKSIFPNNRIIIYCPGVHRGSFFSVSNIQRLADPPQGQAVHGVVNRFARQLIKSYGSTADQATIRQALQEMGDHLVQNDSEALSFACRQFRNKVIDTKPQIG